MLYGSYLVLSVLYSDPVVLDLAPTDLDPIEDGEAMEHPLVDETMPFGSHDLAIVLYRARDAPEREGSGPFTVGICFPFLWFVYFLFGFIYGFGFGHFLGLAASIILQRLRELMVMYGICRFVDLWVLWVCRHMDWWSIVEVLGIGIVLF